MYYNVIPTPQFKKDIKYYINKKKYTKIKDDINEILDNLKEGNFIGNEVVYLRLPEDENIYKVRAVNSSINVGKSNGFRLIYYVVKNDTDIYLLTMYSKKDKGDISNNEIAQLVKKYCK